MSETWRARLKAAMKERGVTGEEIAARMDVHPVTVSKLLNGRMKMTEQWMGRFAGALDMEAAAIVGGPPEPPATRRQAAGTIPVYGLAAGAFAGAFTMTTDEVERVPAPPGLAHVRDAYALIVTGTSMEPRYTAGDFIYVNPHRPPRPGDHVVVQIRDHRTEGRQTFIKRYMGETAGMVVVSQYNPPMNTEWKREHVSLLHRVLTVNELLGV